jgi:hypothetical protein
VVCDERQSILDQVRSAYGVRTTRDLGEVLEHPNLQGASRLDLGKLHTEENILWSFAPHDISAILFLLGEMPAESRATVVAT